MARQSRKHELLAAWRALTSSSATDGWRTIAVSSNENSRIYAGRFFPGNKESLLVGFHSIHMPAQGQLPKGRGFTVAPASLGPAPDGYIWIALSREMAGGLELFTLMADDIVGTLAESGTHSQEQLFHLFLSRIRAWQDFMQRGTDGVLGPESELGLCGELTFLHLLLDAGLPADIAVSGWVGPLDGIQDFIFATGATEVKATLAEQGFNARIGSLAQLDDSLVQSLFIAGMRFSLSTSGKTLPEIISGLRLVLKAHASALSTFEYRLLHAGFYEAVAEKYTRRFCHVGTRLLCVEEGFPRLTRSGVDSRIRDARYEIDLDLVSQEETELKEMLKITGAM